MGTRMSASVGGPHSVRITNRNGTSPYVVICDHASNFVPAKFADLGLSKADLERHIAWDPGAAPVAAAIAETLDAAMIESGISRLVIDCNRPLDAPDLISAVSEATIVPGNANLSPAARQERIDCSWQPFHDAVEEIVSERLKKGIETRLVTIHSFTPVYNDVHRPWQIGVIHDEDDSLASPMIAALKAVIGPDVGVNQPYSPADRVYFTLEQHGRKHNLACAMIEIRNDEIADAAGQLQWAELLAAILQKIHVEDVVGTGTVSEKGSSHA